MVFQMFYLCHNTANSFVHLVIVGSYIQFTADSLSQNEFCLNLGADFLCVRLVCILLKQQGVFMLRMRISSLVPYA